MAALSWSTPFYEPIILPDGQKLIKLKDAATYVTNLPKKESNLRNGKLPLRCCCFVAVVATP